MAEVTKKNKRKKNWKNPHSFWKRKKPSYYINCLVSWTHRVSYLVDAKWWSERETCLWERIARTGC